MTGSRPTLALNEHNLLFLRFSSYLELPNHQYHFYITYIQTEGVFGGKLNANPLKNVKELALALVMVMSGPRTEHNWYKFEVFVAFLAVNVPITSSNQTMYA